MSTRTGAAITDYLTYGGTSGSSVLMDAALDMAWAWVEEEISTNIIVTLESQEIHLWPREARDWNERNDRIQTDKTHVSSVASVTLLADVNGCTCNLTTFSGCAIVVNGETGLLAVRECTACAQANCACGSSTIRPYQAQLAYYAGLFPTPPLDKDVLLAVILKAREAFEQLQPGPVSGLGSIAVTSWSSMDYSESRAAPKKGTYLDDYIDRLLRPYKTNRPFSLRRTY